MPAPCRGRRPRHLLLLIALCVSALRAPTRAERRSIRASPPCGTRPFPPRGNPRGVGTDAKPEPAHGWWLGTAVVAIALAACGWGSVAARRFRPIAKLGIGGTNAPLRIVGRASLSPRHAVFLLETGGRVLIVGTGPQAAPSLLGELTDPDTLGASPLRLAPRGSTRSWETTHETIHVNFRRNCHIGRRRGTARLCARKPTDKPPAPASPSTNPRPPSTAPTAKPKPVATPPRTSQPTPAPTAAPALSAESFGLKPEEVTRSVAMVGVFALASLVPAAVLMITAFVRINVVLVLLRQALGSPQVPGNQVLTALALLLTALVMRPVGVAVYTRGVLPYAEKRATWDQATQAAVVPVKAFMLDQIVRTGHGDYLWSIHDELAPADSPEPFVEDDFPIAEVATAYLLSELTTALLIGFLLYLPFLVVDLVTSAVLAAMGLFMLPPSLVAMPLKLILFVLADGWLHVATMLLRGFGPVSS